MVQTLFILQFKAQLRRTRPEMIRRLENAVRKAIRDAGGKITGERLCITAEYDENSLGFWLDILILIETLQKLLNEEGSKLYGYSLLVGKDLPEKPESLCRSLAAGPQWGGIFLDPAAQQALEAYISHEEVQTWPSADHFRDRAGKKNLARLKGFKQFAFESRQNFPHREAIVKALNQEAECNTLILGPEFLGKRDGLYSFCNGTLGDLPPLVFRFNSGGLNAFTDSWSFPIRTLAAGTGLEKEIAEINDLWEFLSHERLRKEPSPFMLQKCTKFLTLLLGLYISAIKKNSRMPTLILENIHLAGKTAVKLFLNLYAGMEGKQGILILGTCAASINISGLKQWEPVFPRLIKLSGENPTPPLPQMPQELWEMAYTFSIFASIFPASLFLQLFEEEGKNPAMASHALSLLCSMKIIDKPEDPRPRISNFSGLAEAALGEKAKTIRKMALNRLLSLVERRKLNPCIELLVILAALGNKDNIDNELILKSIYADLVTAPDTEYARYSKTLRAVAGKERGPAIMYIYQTMRVLLQNGEKGIRNVFKDPPPDCTHFPVLKAQMLANNAAYHLGLRDIPLTLEAVKEAILLNQEKSCFSLAQSYRLFSLAALSKKQISESGDYLDFAMENAERSGNSHELGVSAYYAATCQFLSGNISKAQRFACKAREQALAAGHPDWADRAHFLEGRLAFEIGSYQEALEIFEAILKNPADGMLPEKEKLLLAWAYRARIYFQNPLAEKPSCGGNDADLFEIEAACLSGDYQKTAKLSNALSNPYTENNFLFTEQPDWRSGFAQCELLYFSRGEMWDRMLCAYRSLALCRISASAGEEAMHNMQRILREEQLSEMDPWDAFYFYVWYRISEQIGAGQVDMNTAVSMAFKRLQRRAGRIDDIETRRQFFSRPRWNSAIHLAAKEFKLI
jgi:tetratricopeptide (TPR) repeat protein